jgi:hypothetical protein
MPSAAIAIPSVATLIGGSMQSRAAEKAAGAAAGAQVASAEAGIEEQRRQFDEISKLLAPYVSAGAGALPGYAPFQAAGQTAFEQQLALTGVRGTGAQQAAIRDLERSPEMQAMVRQGEEALLQQASATGGLRGGNVQAALAQFRPQMLARQIETQLGRLSGIAATGLGATGELAGLGQAAAARQAALGGATGSAISGLLGQQGQARAGAALAGGASPVGQFLSAVPGMAGTYFGMTGQSPFSGSLGGLQASFAQTGLGRSGFGTGLAYGNQDLGAFF